MADPIHPSAEKVEKVASLLVARRSDLERPPRLADVPLPQLPRPLVEALGRQSITPEAPATREPAGPAIPSVSPDPSRLKLPEGPTADRQASPETSPIEEGSARAVRIASANDFVPATPPAVPAVSVRPQPALTERVTSSLSSPPPASPPERNAGSPTIPDAATGLRTGAAVLVRVSPSAGPTGQGSGGVPTAEVGPQRPSSRPELPVFVGGRTPLEATGPLISPGAAAPALPTRLLEGERAGRAPVDRSFAGFDPTVSGINASAIGPPAPGSPGLGDGPIPMVRNPLSADPGRFAMAGPAPASQNGPASIRSGIGAGPVDPASGSLGSPQGGTTVDLTRTNELLQQLLDAVRKQRSSSLPSGGRSVYPER